MAAVRALAPACTRPGPTRGNPGAKARNRTIYVVQQCLENWLASLTMQARTTVVRYRTAADHTIELLGRIKLANLEAHDVQVALEILATRWSSRTVRLDGMVMVRAVRLAQVNGLAMRTW